MRIERCAALACVLLAPIAPTKAFSSDMAATPKGRAIKAMNVGDRKIEFVAVTARARADSPRRKAYLRECRSYSKIMPGYPQPAIVSVDMRIAF